MAKPSSHCCRGNVPNSATTGSPIPWLWMFLRPSLEELRTALHLLGGPRALQRAGPLWLTRCGDPRMIPSRNFAARTTGICGEDRCEGRRCENECGARKRRDNGLCGICARWDWRSRFSAWWRASAGRKAAGVRQGKRQRERLVRARNPRRPRGSLLCRETREIAETW